MGHCEETPWSVKQVLACRDKPPLVTTCSNAVFCRNTASAPANSHLASVHIHLSQAGTPVGGLQGPCDNCEANEGNFRLSLTWG